MERNDRYYGNRGHKNYGDNRDQQFDNYRDRYSNRGNYYGMEDARQAYRDVKSSGGSSSYGRGPMQSGRHEDYRTGGRDQYRYGDQNPYMSHERNRDYGRSNEFGWRSERDTGHSRGDSFGARDRYGRQDNSYRYSGEGRRYSEFARDEKRTDDRNRSYNAGTADHYIDRGPQPERREDNDYGRDQEISGESPYYEGTYDTSDFKYSGVIRTPLNRSDEGRYSSGRYGSDRGYKGEHHRQAGSSDGEHVSSRRRHPRSGPDYSANSPISSYGYTDFGA